MTDGDEVNTHLTDPNDGDSDHDTMPDGWEVSNSLDPLLDDSTGDPDADGLTNLEEYQNNTDPNDADSDEDGLSDGDEVNTHLTDPDNADSDDDNMPDGWEVANALDPLTNDASNDPDLDDLTNYNEFLVGTNPKLEDTDGDGYNDGFEVNNGYDPLDATDYPRADPSIPSYDLYLLIGLISVISAILIRKRLSDSRLV